MNRRIRRSAATLDAMLAAPFGDYNTRFTPLARHTWHLSEHKRRSNLSNDPHLHISHHFQPHDPLHTQWLSGTFTPWEYQHLVRRSTANATYEARWEQMEANLADNADDTGGVYPDHDWWLRVASEIEDDFLYRFSAPCGAD